MKRILAWLVLTVLTLLPLSVLAEAGAAASLRVGWFPPERFGQYDAFIPDEDAARELTALLDEVAFHDITDFPGAWPDKDAASLGITLEYGGYYHDLRGDGWIRASEIDGLGLKYAQDARVMACVMNLLSDRGYAPFDPAGLTAIVRAELCDGPRYAGEAREPMVIEDADRLAVLEGLLRVATPSDASGCPFGYARLTLTNGNGDAFTLYPATDSCAQYYIGGSFFNYDTRRGDEDHNTNQAMFDLFGINPTDYFHFAE